MRILAQQFNCRHRQSVPTHLLHHWTYFHLQHVLWWCVGSLPTIPSSNSYVLIHVYFLLHIGNKCSDYHFLHKFPDWWSPVRHGSGSSNNSVNSALGRNTQMVVLPYSLLLCHTWNHYFILAWSDYRSLTELPKQFMGLLKSFRRCLCSWCTFRVWNHLFDYRRDRYICLYWKTNNSVNSCS